MSRAYAVIGDKVANGLLRDLAHVVVALLHTQTGETHGRLTTAACGRVAETVRLQKGRSDVGGGGRGCLR